VRDTFRFNLIVVIIVAGSEEEVVGASFVTKMPSCKEKTTIFTDFVETDGTFEHSALFF
jgi:hypothetical protein